MIFVSQGNRAAGITGNVTITLKFDSTLSTYYVFTNHSSMFRSFANSV
jgi:hypothetical protein